MSEKEFVYIICPYCGVRQKHFLKRGGPQIVLCDCENAPGCDRYFAVSLTMIPKVSYFSVNETDESLDYTEQRLAEEKAEREKHKESWTKRD